MALENCLHPTVTTMTTSSTTSTITIPQIYSQKKALDFGCGITLCLREIQRELLPPTWPAAKSMSTLVPNKNLDRLFPSIILGIGQDDWSILGQDGEKPNSHTVLMGISFGTATLETIWKHLINLNISIHYDQHSHNELYAQHIHPVPKDRPKNVHSRIIYNCQKTDITQCLSTTQWVNNCDTVIQENYCYNKTAWVNFTNVMCIERNQTQ